MPSLYTPNPEEVEIFAFHDHIHNMSHWHQVAARMVCKINEHLHRGIANRVTICGPETTGRAYNIDDVNVIGRCYCAQFQHEPVLVPHGYYPIATYIEAADVRLRSVKYEPSCVHTIAWRAYRAILTHHYQVCRPLRSLEWLRQYELWQRREYTLPMIKLLDFSAILQAQKETNEHNRK